MKLYAFTTPEISKHNGYLKIGETNGDIDKRVDQECHELNVKKEIVWRDAAITDRSHIDKMIHRHLVDQGFPIQQFDVTGQNTEWVKCTVTDIEKVFAVVKQQLYNDEIQRQTLCDKFYLEIRNWYYWTAKTGDDPYSVAVPEFTLRLIIRLLLCFFLQEKGLVPKELFDEHFLKENLKENEEYRYYNAILRNVFFHCLNTPIKERNEIEHKKLIKNIRNIKEQFAKIPFLNGGLFYEYEGDDFPLNHEHFFSEPTTRTIPELDGDYKVAGIIKILSQYQYKLSVDDLFDLEYAQTIDPEFIGKVFESLLACIDADTKENKRKTTGSFYTPREIVDYMVCEALDTYLKNNTVKNNKVQINSDDLLQCKILDPACGSGVFPCGVMNEIIRRIDPDKQFSQQERYRKKLEILQKVIYCIDIQSMAVQISSLRFFLSLIQEIVPDKKKDNYGIEPLPNLETKFICANTLISLKNGKQKKLELPIIKATIEQLLHTREQHLIASDPQEKERLQKYDETLRKTLSIAMEDAGDLSHETAELLIQWNPYNQTKSAPFFDPQWMFGVTNGFDIVIGNPPYVEAKKLKHIAATLKNYFSVYSGTADLSVYFIEQGLNLCKNNGLLLLITTNKFFNTGYGKPVRQLLLKNQIYSIINFEQVEVFEHVLVSSVILGVHKQTPNKKSFIYHRFYKLKATEFKTQFTSKAKLNFGSYQQRLLNENEWSFSDDIKLELKDKIETAGKNLSELEGVAVYRGVTTGYNPAFIIDKNKMKELITADKNNKTIIKPLLQGRNIKKWIYNYSNDYLLKTNFDTDIEKDYPLIFNHLSVYKKELEIRADQGTRWFNLRACTYYHEFEKSEKIIWGLTVDQWAYAYDDKQHYLPSNGYILTSETIPIKYLLGLLNSNLLKFYFGFIGVMTAGGAYTLKYATVSQLPIVVAKNMRPIISLVDQILSTKKKNPTTDTSNFESQIDAIVFHLYGLTEEQMITILLSMPSVNESERQQIQDYYKNYKRK
ncbi:MAG: Eco57I restriction-modification methylase domain-containing protein [Planctomycetaceae bacterium]|jgi:hypothetical protein|nr:Eco57I restriction-modification methylase domain-containing protein [Planctomycetaceae bacterium]